MLRALPLHAAMASRMYFLGREEGPKPALRLTARVPSGSPLYLTALTDWVRYVMGTYR